MRKKNAPDSNEIFSDKANRVGIKIAKVVKMVLVLLLIVGVVYVLKSCGIIGNHGKPDTSDNTSTEQEYDDYDYEVEDTDDDELDVEDVALYIHTYHKLPSNYMTKKEATEKGYYKNPKKNGIMIGGDSFGNYEELLPPNDDYYECDVDYKGNGRGKNRLIYTTDGTVYHTKNHYKSFTQLY